MKVMKIMGSMIINNFKYTTLLGPLKMNGNTNDGQDYKIVFHFPNWTFRMLNKPLIINSRFT